MKKKGLIMSFGYNIKQLRITNNLTQAQFGEALGFSQKTISGWENGGKVPDIETIRNIIKMFNISLEELFAEEIQT